MKQLICKIMSVTHGLSSPNYEYAVFDGESIVAVGISSSESFVRSDAGGYHTKETFDELYPDGWNVTFDFDTPKAQEE